ncbi:MAG: flagellar basal body P-ring formation chaperone FlgA, partial [Desulfurobacteriaceae bacterium]
VKRVCIYLKEDELKKRIVSLFRKKFPDWEIVSISVPRIIIPYSSFKDSLEVEKLDRRYARVRYTIFRNGKPVKRVFITLRVEKKQSVVVAKKNIPKGKIITFEDLEVVKLPESKAKNTFLSKEEVIGRVARRDIRKGEVIRERDILPHFIVFKGKPVKVVYSSGTIHIEILGIALENGSLGDIIKVKNISTGKVLLCRVIGNGIVKFLSK